MGVSGAMAAISAGSSVVGGISSKRAADSAAEKAQAAANFNAEIIERDIGLLEDQRGIINANFITDAKRSRTAFERDVQGDAIAGFAYGGFELSGGTPLEVLRENARQFDFDTAVEAFNNEMTNLQLSDAQEDSRLNAELTRMTGQATGLQLKAEGRASLISGIGAGARSAKDSGYFD